MSSSGQTKTLTVEKVFSLLALFLYLWRMDRLKWNIFMSTNWYFISSYKNLILSTSSCTQVSLIAHSKYIVIKNFIFCFETRLWQIRKHSRKSFEEYIKKDLKVLISFQCEARIPVYGCSTPSRIELNIGPYILDFAVYFSDIGTTIFLFIA